MKRGLKVISAAIATVLLLTGCDIPSEVQNNSSTISAPPLISRSTSSTKSEPVESNVSTSEISEPDEPAKQTESAVPDELVSEPVS